MWRGKVGEGGGGGGGEGWSGIKKYETRKEVQKGTKLEEEVKQFKRKNTKIRNETLFCSFAKQLEKLFSYFRIFFVSRNDLNSAKQ